MLTPLKRPGSRSSGAEKADAEKALRGCCAMRRRVGPTKAPTAARGFPLPLETDRCLRVLLHSGQYLLEQGQGYRVRKQYEVIGIRAGYSNAAWIDFITTDDQCGGVHFKLAERLWDSILTMKRANVSQEPAWKRNFVRKPLRPAARRFRTIQVRPKHRLTLPLAGWKMRQD